MSLVHPPASVILSIRDLVVEFQSEGGWVRVVDGISLDLPRGKTIGLVGESGSGKTATALSILRLIATPPGRIAGGQILYDGRDLLALPEHELRRLRGNRIAMVFQDPMTSLNPVYAVGEQIAEVLRAHQGLSRRAAARRAIDLLERVGIPEPASRADAFPHQLSGGMRQRVLIAMALACGPEILIADEPTTALDVTIQAQILELLAGLQRELGMTILLITHDLGVVAEVCDEVVVLYAGAIAERAPTRELFASPRHPYTAGLLRSLPRLGQGRDRLPEIPGIVPDLRHLPAGCRFQDRCARAAERCRVEEPPLEALSAGRAARCFFPEGAA
jgi:peptide/nickel transport system ATP-binding protein